MEAAIDIIRAVAWPVAIVLTAAIVGRAGQRIVYLWKK